MAIGTPTGIGSGTSGIASTGTLTTSGSAPSNSLVIFLISWGASTAKTLTSVSGGGLTWAIDHQQAFAGAIPWGFAVVSAQAPAGLASSTVITGTYSAANVFASLMAAVYCTGLSATSPGVKDVSDGGTGTAAAWDTTATSTTVSDTLVIGGCLTDGLKTNTVSGGASELYDFQWATDAWSMCVEYKILASASSASLTGTWTAGVADKTSAFVAYKADTGAAAAAVLGPSFVAIPLMR